MFKNQTLETPRVHRSVLGPVLGHRFPLASVTNPHPLTWDSL